MADFVCGFSYLAHVW